MMWALPPRDSCERARYSADATDDKARILVESLKPGANVSELARRNGLSPQQLFGWRREVREPIGERASEPASKTLLPDLTAPTPSPVHKRGRPKQGRGERYPNDDTPTFAAVVIAAPAAPPSPPPAGASPSGVIEITIGEAIRYGLRHWDGLCRFLDDGRIEIDSNTVERSIRGLALNRNYAQVRIMRSCRCRRSRERNFCAALRHGRARQLHIIRGSAGTASTGREACSARPTGSVAAVCRALVLSW
jgi:transposase-like protein